MLYKRHIKARLIELLDDFRIVYLTGPRQSGKSTLVREIAKEKGIGYYTLDDTAFLASAQSDPHGLLGSLPTPLVLDEFQMAPNLINAIKMILMLPMVGMGSFFLPDHRTSFAPHRSRNRCRGIWHGWNFILCHWLNVRGDSIT